MDQPRCETCKHSKWWAEDTEYPADLYCFHSDSEYNGENVSPLHLACCHYEEQGVGKT